MKSSICLLFFASLTAQITFAQDLATSITEVDTHEGLAWSNTVTNAYSMVEWTPFLTGVWNPLDPPGICVTGFLGRTENGGSWSNV